MSVKRNCVMSSENGLVFLKKDSKINAWPGIEHWWRDLKAGACQSRTETQVDALALSLNQPNIWTYGKSFTRTLQIDQQAWFANKLTKEGLRIHTNIGCFLNGTWHLYLKMAALQAGWKAGWRPAQNEIK